MVPWHDVARSQIPNQPCMIRDFCDYSKKVAELQIAAIAAADDAKAKAEAALEAAASGPTPIVVYAQSLVRGLSVAVLIQSFTELARCSAHRGEVPDMKHGELYASEVCALKCCADERLLC